MNRELEKRWRKCRHCIHFGEVRKSGGDYCAYVCLAPITTEPPASGEVPTRHRFVYKTYPNGECELWTGMEKHEAGK